MQIKVMMMNIFKSFFIFLMLILGFSKADGSDKYKEEIELVERIASRMVTEASQHARCFGLAGLANETLLSKLHFAHATDVLEMSRFQEIAKEEMDLLNANKPKNKSLEEFAYERYNANCKHMYLGRPKY